MANIGPKATLEDRTGRNERQLAMLTSNVEALTQNLHNVASMMQKGFTKVEGQVETLSNKFVDAHKPQWGAIGMMFAIIVAVIGWFLSSKIDPVQRDVNSVNARLTSIEVVRETRYENEAKLRERIAVLEERMKNAH